MLIRELSLFSGNGGGLIATTIFHNIVTVGYVEFNSYCQQVLSQRIKDGHLHEAPIFCDIKTFINQGYAKEYKGMVELITGGFPCQPFSSAGLHKAQEDERNMWPATQEVIRIIQPRFLLLENVENLLHFRYVHEIFGGLAKVGYNVKWTVLSAKDTGAFFKRDRLWILGERINLSRNNSI